MIKILGLTVIKPLKKALSPFFFGGGGGGGGGLK